MQNGKVGGGTQAQLKTEEEKRNEKKRGEERWEGRLEK